MLAKLSNPTNKHSKPETIFNHKNHAVLNPECNVLYVPLDKSNCKNA